MSYVLRTVRNLPHLLLGVWVTCFLGCVPHWPTHVITSPVYISRSRHKSKATNVLKLSSSVSASFILEGANLEAMSEEGNLIPPPPHPTHLTIGLQYLSCCFNVCSFIILRSKCFHWVDRASTVLILWAAGPHPVPPSAAVPVTHRLELSTTDTESVFPKSAHVLTFNFQHPRGFSFLCSLLLVLWVSALFLRLLKKRWVLKTLLIKFSFLFLLLCEFILAFFFITGFTRANWFSRSTKEPASLC